MARKLKDPMQFTQGTSAQIATQTLKPGEPVFDTTAKTLVMGDGAKAGGHPLVNTTTDQSIAGNKTFTGELKLPPAITISADATPAQILALLNSTDPLKGVNVQLLLAALAGYLPLSGGTVSGNIFIKGNNKGLYISAENIDNSTDFTGATSLGLLAFQDKNGSILAQCYAARGYWGVTAYLFAKAADNSVAMITAVSNTDGTTYATAPTPSTTAPNNAIYNKEALNRDFLSKSGGEVTGNVDRKSSIDITSPLTTNLAVNALRILDKDGVGITGISTTQTPNGNLEAQFWLHADSNTWPALKVIQHPDRTAYATCPPPRGTYTDDIATFKSMVDYASKELRQNLSVYIKPSTGSDTADINNGRGLSQDMPFKSLRAATTWLLSYNQSQICSASIILLEDMTINEQLAIYCSNFKNINMYGISPTINLTIAVGGISVYLGLLYVNNITLTVNNNCYAALQADFNGFLVTQANLTINGNIGDNNTSGRAVIRAIRGGRVSIENTIAGNVTGCRYICGRGGTIFSNGLGANAIPGSEAGQIVDNASFYI